MSFFYYYLYKNCIVQRRKPVKRLSPIRRLARRGGVDRVCGLAVAGDVEFREYVLGLGHLDGFLAYCTSGQQNNMRRPTLEGLYALIRDIKNQKTFS